jgi:hypothetical protein
MSKKIKRLDTIDEVLDFIDEVPIEVVQNWAQISVILIQLAKNNRIDEWMECRKKLKEIYIENPELSKIRIFYAKEILREIKLKKILV